MEKLSQALNPSTSMNVPLLLLVSIDQRWDRYRMAWKEFLGEPSGDTVRRLRVATRRLRTLMKLLDELHPYKALEKAIREYQDQLDGLDGLRDTRVMLDQVTGMIPQFPALEPFRLQLEKREAKAIRRAKKEFKNVEPGETVRVLLRWMERLDGEETQAFADKLMESIDASYAQVCERYGRVDPGDPNTIHQVRLAFKKFRYKIEALQPLLQNYPPDAIQCLDAYQGWMGAVQDIQVLCNALGDYAKENAGLDVSPVNAYFDQKLAMAVAEYMKHKDTISDFWRPDPGQPFPWRQTNENLSVKAWNCDGA